MSIKNPVDNYSNSAMLLSMRQIELEFQTNANQSGLHTFTRMAEGVNPEGKRVYIYKRTKSDNSIFGYEVFIPSVKKAGTYPLPGGKTITYTEDFEEYPGASKFGLSAWFCTNETMANKRFQSIIGNAQEIVDVSDADDEPTEIQPVKSAGRPKADRPALLVPVGEFSTTELAEHNKVDYPIAAVFVRENVAAGKLKFVRAEQRNAKGKKTNLFTKI